MYGFRLRLIEPDKIYSLQLNNLYGDNDTITFPAKQIVFHPIEAMFE